jgi:hypothetical protein
MTENDKYTLNFIDVYVVKERIRRSHDSKELHHNFKTMGDAERFLEGKLAGSGSLVGKRFYSDIKVFKAVTFDGKTVHVLGNPEKLI